LAFCSLNRTFANEMNVMKQDQIVIYQTEDGQTQIDVRLENETVWLTQCTTLEKVEWFLT